MTNEEIYFNEEAVKLIEKFYNIPRQKMADYSRIEWPTAKAMAKLHVELILDSELLVPQPKFDRLRDKKPRKDHLEYWYKLKEAIQHQ